MIQLQDVHRFAKNICQALADIRSMFEQHMKDHPKPDKSITNGVSK